MLQSKMIRFSLKFHWSQILFHKKISKIDGFKSEIFA